MTTLRRPLAPTFGYKQPSTSCQNFAASDFESGFVEDDEDISQYEQKMRKHERSSKVGSRFWWWGTRWHKNFWAKILKNWKNKNSQKIEKTRFFPFLVQNFDALFLTIESPQNSTLDLFLDSASPRPYRSETLQKELWQSLYGKNGFAPPPPAEKSSKFFSDRAEFELRYPSSSYNQSTNNGTYWTQGSATR